MGKARSCSAMAVLVGPVRTVRVRQGERDSGASVELRCAARAGCDYQRGTDRNISGSTDAMGLILIHSFLGKSYYTNK